MVEFEKKILNDQIRNESGKRFIKLTDGVTNYELDGNPEDSLVVFIHGFSIPMYVWDHNYYAIRDAGFQVLRYDLFGRGYSDRPKCKYNPDLFDNQLKEMLHCLDLDGKKFTIIGLSMGGIVALNFIDRHPEMIEKIILFDPAGLPQKEEIKQKLLKIPILNKLIFKIAGNSILINGLPNNFHHYERYPDFKNGFIEQMYYKGYQNAIINTYQNMPMFNGLDVYERVGKLEMPLLLFWGREDKVIPFDQSKIAQKVLGNLEFHALDDTGHNSNYESPDVVNPILISFLKSVSS